MSNASHTGKAIAFENIAPFDFNINYVEIDSVSHLNRHDSHIHEECEIYINLSGDVSFLVEDRVYHITAGDIIITRPSEIHHCIYRSNALHKHFWILFSARGNEQFLDFFFSRPHGSKNLITPSSDIKNQIIAVCRKLSELPEDTCAIDKYKLFFDLMSLLRAAANTKTPQMKTSLPEEVSAVIDYLQNNFTAPLKVADLAAIAHVSVNTLERKFSEALLVTPSEYIRRKRLTYAKELLCSNISVQEVCEKCGFTDYSHFIASFKKQFGITPLKFKKTHLV